MHSKLEEMFGRVKTELKEKNAWIYEILTDKKVHAAFLHMQYCETNKK